MCVGTRTCESQKVPFWQIFRKDFSCPTGFGFRVKSFSCPAGRSTASVPSTPTPPTWPAQAERWTDSIPEIFPDALGALVPETGVSVPETEVTDLGATLTKVMGMAVAVKKSGGVVGRQAGITVMLTSTPGKPAALSEP
jgi:hypothetical protein